LRDVHGLHVPVDFDAQVVGAHELLGDRPGGLAGESEFAPERRDVHAWGGVDGFERPVSGEGDREALEGMVHGDFHAVAEAARGDHEFPAGDVWGEWVAGGHGWSAA
jgi:hypothetical protein